MPSHSKPRVSGSKQYPLMEVLVIAFISRLWEVRIDVADCVVIGPPLDADKRMLRNCQLAALDAASCREGR